MARSACLRVAVLLSVIRSDVGHSRRDYTRRPGNFLAWVLGKAVIVACGGIRPRFPVLTRHCIVKPERDGFDVFVACSRFDDIVSYFHVPFVITYRAIDRCEFEDGNAARRGRRIRKESE